MHHRLHSIFPCDFENRESNPPPPPDRNKRKRLVTHPKQNPTRHQRNRCNSNLSSNQAPTKLQPNPGSKTQLQHITDTGPSVPVYRYSLCARQNISTAVLDTYTHTDVTPIPLIYLDVFDFGAFVLNLATCS